MSFDYPFSGIPVLDRVKRYEEQFDKTIHALQGAVVSEAPTRAASLSYSDNTTTS